MMSTTEERIKDVFSLQDTLNVEKVKKLRDFAFVHYKTREEAEKALQSLNNTDIDASTVEVTWAKPVDKSMRPKFRQGIAPLVPSYPQCLYATFPMDSYVNSPIPVTHYAGRGSFMPRGVFRGRSRGAAGVRRPRTYTPSFPSQQGVFKPQEGPHSAHTPHYSQFHAGKQNRIPEEGKSYPEYYMVVGDGMAYPYAVPAAGLGIHGGRIGDPYIATQAYELPSYMEYPPSLPASSVAHY